MSTKTYIADLDCKLSSIHAALTARILELSCLGICVNLFRRQVSELKVRAQLWSLSASASTDFDYCVSEEQEAEWNAIYSEYKAICKQIRYRFIPAARNLHRLDAQLKCAHLRALNRTQRLSAGKPADDLFGERSDAVIAATIKYANHSSESVSLMLTSLSAMRDIAQDLDHREFGRLKELSKIARKFATREALVAYFVDHGYLISEAKRAA